MERVRERLMKASMGGEIGNRMITGSRGSEESDWRGRRGGKVSEVIGWEGAWK